MVNAVNADIPGEPAQDWRKVLVGTAMRGRPGKAPLGILIPNGVLELVLDIEQPHPRRGRNQCDR